MFGRSRIAALSALVYGLGAMTSIPANAIEPRRASMPPAFAAPYGGFGPALVFGYPRKDRHKNAAQVKRASIKAANRASNRRNHRG